MTSRFQSFALVVLFAGLHYLLVSLDPSLTALSDDDPFRLQIQPFLVSHCSKCHDSTRDQREPKGGVDFGVLQTEKDIAANAELLGQIIDVLDSNDMPPESEPEIQPAKRKEIVKLLKKVLSRQGQKSEGIRTRAYRLNRFQYNNTVRDLFKLDRDVFALTEKLMTRHSRYIQANTKQMPSEIQASSNALNPVPGLRDVKPFPKDLRAAHGFDNQSNQLTMSPLLLDAFLKLAVSIVESPDFNERTVGVWKDFFQPDDKESAENQQALRQRLTRFLTLAFRRPVEEEIVERYTQFALAKIRNGMTYTDAMKKVASAVLSSPLFLFRVQSDKVEARQIELASDLSYFLWSSGPDEELLRLAIEGKLQQADTLDATVNRMMSDPRIERFLDTFPAQWLQLENVLAATPDPQKQRLFSIDKSYPASLQMLIEPLLQFDYVFVEDRPIKELILPQFGYRSDFLTAWYTSDLKPPRVDVKKIIAQNKGHDQRREALQRKVEEAKQRLAKLVDPVRESILANKKSDTELPPVDLKPIAAWDFDGNLKASVGSLDLQPNGKIEFKNGMVVLNNAFLLSQAIPVDLKEKTLEVWCVPHNLDQRGGGVMGIQGQGDFFDTIVIGERKPRHWISGSNGFSRTLDFPGSTPEEKANELIHLVMVYRADGTTLMYRNGQPYGKPFNKGRAVFPKDRSKVIFGLRHLPPGGGKYLNVSIDQAQLYNRALTADEVAAANRGKHLFVSEAELSAAMTDEQKKLKVSWEQQIANFAKDLKQVPANQDPNKAKQDARFRFDADIRRKLRGQTFRRVRLEDPRYGGVITNAAVMSMTSGPKRSHPIARGAWIIEVIFNDPPPPPPNDVPPLNEESGDQNLTIREKFKAHRENPDCAGCHSRLDPLGFAMENFDLTGRWRDKYDNGRDVDMKGKLFRRHAFGNVADFKRALVEEDQRFAKAFTEHLLRFAISRELNFRDRLVADEIVTRTKPTGYSIKATIKEVISSKPFLKLK